MGQIVVERNLDGIEGLCLITPAVHGDSRGFFMETYNPRDMEEAGFHIAKLVRVIKGEVFDVAVDLRSGSRTYGKWHGEVLTEENKKQFLIPCGFAHGYLVLSSMAEFCYKCDDFYHPNDEGGLAWNDPDIGIVWPKVQRVALGTANAEGFTVDGAPLILNERDQKWPGIRNAFRFE